MTLGFSYMKQGVWVPVNRVAVNVTIAEVSGLKVILSTLVRWLLVQNVSSLNMDFYFVP
jgi:hypothetical protein